jgi:G3E family GTPase
MGELTKIPVFVLTGFLGSGKTVLLNGLLRQPGLADSAVVVNEFGEIGLDHLLVSSSQENIVLLDAGCLCCAVLGSLKETLADLFQRRVQGHAPMFERVLIETTGLADPGPILQSIMRDSLVSAFYRLAGLICVVDALFGLDEMDAHAEARAQVALADRILITKTDRTSGACPSDLLARLRMLNPTAEILVATQGNVDAGAIIGSGTATTVPWLGSLDAVHHHDHDNDPTGIHDSAITAECFWIDRTATWSGLAAWIDTTRRKYGRDLLRCKGIIKVIGVPGPVLVHGVQTLFDTTRLAAWPDQERRSRLVVIGKGLERDVLANSLSWLAAPEGTQPPTDPITPAPDWAATWTAA